MKKTLCLISGVVLLMVAPIVGILCYWSFSEMRASTDWPSARGTITVSELSMPDARRGGAKADVRYRYRVERARFTGSRIRFADMTGSGSHRQGQLIAPYPVGATVSIYYDPVHPERSVLEPGGGVRAYGLVVPPLATLIPGVFLLVAGLRTDRPPAPTPRPRRRA